jgi:hypothetical protein
MAINGRQSIAHQFNVAICAARMVNRPSEYARRGLSELLLGLVSFQCGRFLSGESQRSIGSGKVSAGRSFLDFQAVGRLHALRGQCILADLGQIFRQLHWIGRATDRPIATCPQFATVNTI